ncbi:putative bacteriocin precursor, CLI_3235 family [Butyrivibrio fibrisolvens DSM 3071]|uniref:Putative bacteriocin, CLI_3235 family n=1 Tax=Butyrivibrio fibrisolvens DSM 3071 TaxID=1121131 RepID=A0A1M5Q7W8_BUTFI|nr:putative bacteriocin precursor, CLI_3235 family [Butyrivibrio fibrisolvens DSM 3071]
MLGKKMKMESGTFMAYASCSCTCFCACKCQNCHSIGEANGIQIANDAQYNTTGVQSRGPILLLNS